MKTPLFAAALMISFCLASCKKGNVKPTGLFGSWELRGQSGTIAGYIKTFPSGNGYILQFNSDSTYQYSHKDTIGGHGPFRIIKNNISFAGATYDGIYFNGSPSGDFIIQKTDSLTIGNTYADGVTSVYVKK